MDLKWSDVDPRTHEFDEARALETVRNAVRNGPSHGERYPYELEHAISNALAAEVGSWTEGWRWTDSEPGGGGPVSSASYCCATHTIKGASRDVVVGKVMDALREFRRWLVKIDGTFRALRVRLQGAEVNTAAAVAASRILPIVLDCTHSSDAWYNTYNVVMGWFLEPWFPRDFDTRELIANVVSGKFESWIAPSDAKAKEVTDEIGQAVAAGAMVQTVPTASAADAEGAELDNATDEAAGNVGVHGVDDANDDQQCDRNDAEVPDALQQWRSVRHGGAVEGNREITERQGPGANKDDGHSRYIREVDAERSQERADRMGRALQMCRGVSTSATYKPLDFALLQSWQRVVLGTTSAESVAFRRTEAFAKDGRERYGIDEVTELVFYDCLAEANDEAAHPVLRAARVYLDVCFFHPFADGNSRAARLAMDFVLRRAGLVLRPDCRTVFGVPRIASDPENVQSLVDVILKLVDKA